MMIAPPTRGNTTDDEAPDWETLDRCRRVVARLLGEFQLEEPTEDGRLTEGDASLLSGHLIDAVRDLDALAGGAHPYDQYVNATLVGWNDTVGVKEINVRAAFIVVQWDAAGLLKLPGASSVQVPMAM